MPLSENEKTEIKQYLALDTETILSDMGLRLPQKTKVNLENAAIEYVAKRHGQDAEMMRRSVNDFQKASIFGGEVAGEYFRRLREFVEDLLGRERDLLAFAACEHFGYCEKKKSGFFNNDEYTLAIALADAMVMYLTGFPLPVTMVATYIIKKGLLDEWCKCS